MTVLSAGTFVSRDLLEDSFASQDPSDDNNGLFLRAQHVGTGYEKPYEFSAVRICSMIQGIRVSLQAAPGYLHVCCDHS